MNTDFEMNTSAKEIHGFSFSGSGREYFGIWIVNLLLSIVTLGIYTAWAKVRRLRYFYGNTWLDGHNFEYHAKPVQILIGRIIVVVVLVIFNIIANISPILSLLLIVPYVVGLPWLINKALAFNARMTSYRNVRFTFNGSYGKALWVFAVLPFFIPVVFGAIIAAIVYGVSPEIGTVSPTNVVLISGVSFVGLIAYLLFIPYVSKQANTYIAERTTFGAAKFLPDMALRPFYQNMGVSFLVSVVPLILVIALFYFASGGSGGVSVFVAGAAQVLILLFYVGIAVGYLVYAAGVRNIAFNATQIEGGHQFHSSVSRFRYAWIILTNLFVSIISIGLLIPWAAVRSWRYLVGQTALETPGLDAFVADQEAQGNVIAAEYLDIDGIDFGL